MPRIIYIILSIFISSKLFSIEHKRVLLLSSYNSSFPTFYQQIEGVKSVLDTHMTEVDLEFMDSKRFIESAHIDLFTQLLSYKLSQTQPYDAIICTDDNALHFIIEHQESLFEGIPVVFCGVNSIPLALAQNSNPYITGITEAVSMKETIELMYRLFPEQKTIYAIVDSSSSGLGDLQTYHTIRSQMPDIQFKEIILYKLSFDEFQNVLQEIPRNIPVLLLSAYRDKTHRTVDFEENLAFIKKNLKAPLFHLWQHGLGNGVLGGKIISHFEQGKEAALLTCQILNGKNVSSIKVTNKSPNRYMFDYTELAQYKVKLKELPDSSVIINLPETFYSRYKNIIYITSLAFVFLFGFILILSRINFKRKKLEKELQKSIRHLYETQKLTSTGSWILNIKQNKTSWSDEVYRIHGLLPGQLKKDIDEYINQSISCFEKSKQDKIRTLFNECRYKGLPYEEVCLFTDFNGKQKWVKIGGKPIFEKNKISAVLGYISDVSNEVEINLDLEKAKQLAETNEKRFRHLFDNNPVSLWEEDLSELKELLKKTNQHAGSLDKYFEDHPKFIYECLSKIKILRINQATVDLFGFESVNHLTDSLHRTFNRKSYQTFKNTLLAIANGKHKIIKETQFRKADGSTIHAIVHVFTFDNNKGSIVAIVDVSALNKTERELALKYAQLQSSESELKIMNKELLMAKQKAEESEHRLKEAQSLAKIGNWEFDIRNKQLYWSDEIYRIFGFQPQEFSTTYDFFLSCVHPDDRGMVDETYLTHLKSGDPYNMVHRIVLPNKEIKYVNERCTSHYDEDGNATYSLGTIVDITESVLKQNELNKAKVKAEENNRLKTEFIHNMSHEIRTPMNGIMGFAELLESQNLSKKQREQYVQVILNSGKQLLRIIDDILEISKLGAKQVNTIETPINLNKLLLEQYSIFNLKAKENNIPLYLKNGLANEDSNIRTDGSKLQKILNNLLENALKFTLKGYIEFGYWIDKDFIKLYVKDTGVGIHKDKQKVVFERFSQEEVELSRKFGGLGLGLSIALENAQILGGSIQLISDKGKGANFIVSVPYKPVNTKPHTITRKNDYEKRVNVLIVEDDDIDFLLLKTLLNEKTDFDFNILRAINGKEAIEAFRNTPIDIILLDLIMPLLNGFEAIAPLQEIHPGKPIIALTGHSSDTNMEKALAAGCNDFMSKPVDHQRLKDVLTRYIG